MIHTLKADEMIDVLDGDEVRINLKMGGFIHRCCHIDMTDRQKLKIVMRFLQSPLPAQIAREPLD